MIAIRPAKSIAAESLVPGVFMQHVVEGQWILWVTPDEECYADIMRDVVFPEMPTDVLIKFRDHAAYPHILREIAKVEIERRKINNGRLR